MNLSGWKDIATHLNQAVRTVQRWEAFGLPVHRVGSSKRAPVVAFTEELDEWQRAAPRRLLDEIQDLKNQVTALQCEVRWLRGGKKLPEFEELLKQSRAMRETAIGMRKILAQHKEERAAREKSRAARAAKRR